MILLVDMEGDCDFEGMFCRDCGDNGGKRVGRGWEVD